ncbi:MAG: MGMT family protein [Bdellovibrionaceae bacterium]|nr:MGMT family protein [Pseudobdellovibrionaceae bacterium]MBX3035051.1 MGMT family protein [Pseudobdellovibrionaceae bacterium]
MAEPTEFSRRVIKMIASIPRGKVATYKQIAGLCGKPHGSRGVAWILKSSSEKHGLPWQRVVSSQGRIAFPVLTRNHQLQKTRLRAEGVVVAANGGIDMTKFQWKKKPKARSPKKNTPRLFL